MTALSDALEAAQAKALAALEKAFVRDVLNESDFLAKLDEIGATDVADQGQLLACLHVLKEQGQTEPAYTEKRKSQPASQAQLDFIGRLCAEKVCRDKTHRRIQAHTRRPLRRERTARGR